VYGSSNGGIPPSPSSSPSSSSLGVNSSHKRCWRLQQILYALYLVGNERAESTVKSATVLGQYATDLNLRGGRNDSHAVNAAEQSSTQADASSPMSNVGNALDRHGGDLQHFRCGHHRAEHCGNERTRCDAYSLRRCHSHCGHERAVGIALALLRFDRAAVAVAGCGESGEAFDEARDLLK
jgi:hypothetical protein